MKQQTKELKRLIMDVHVVYLLVNTYLLELNFTDWILGIAFSACVLPTAVTID